MYEYTYFISFTHIIVLQKKLIIQFFLKLYDHENRIAMEAVDVLEEACEDEVCLGSVII